jgi:excisionase family DNA binding protein
MTTEEIDQIANRVIICTKEVLTFEEAARYTGYAKSYLYKLTSQNQIKHYKPTGKVIFFNRLELEQWLQAKRISTLSELNEAAQSYCLKKGGAL